MNVSYIAINVTFRHKCSECTGDGPIEKKNVYSMWLLFCWLAGASTQL